MGPVAVPLGVLAVEDGVVGVGFELDDRGEVTGGGEELAVPGTHWE